MAGYSETYTHAPSKNGFLRETSLGQDKKLAALRADKLVKGALNEHVRFCRFRS
jgi:hypothetical protein